jgi:hypothetical protein
MHPVLAVTLALFVVFLLFYVVHGIFVVYHLLRFSVRPDMAKILALVYGITSIILLLVAGTFVVRIRWNAPLLLPAGVSADSRIR